MPSVFLSHSSKDKPFVRGLAARLARHGVSVWVDEAQLNVGDSLIDKIANGIHECDFIAAVISLSSVQSQWVQKELHWAMTREIEGRRVRVLPILIEPCKDQIPFFLRDKLYADFSTPGSYDSQFARLLRAMTTSSPNGRETEEHNESGAVGDVEIGSVIHDRGDDYLGFRVIRRRYRSGLQAFAMGVLGLAFVFLFYESAPRTPLIFFLYFSACVALYATLTILSATLIRHSFELDRNLILELERVGEAGMAFTRTWRRQLEIGLGNKAYEVGKYLEAMAHVSAVVAIGFGLMAMIGFLLFYTV